jgi:hypothetical protein
MYRYDLNKLYGALVVLVRLDSCDSSYQGNIQWHWARYCVMPAWKHDD